MLTATLLLKFSALFPVNAISQAAEPLPLFPDFLFPHAVPKHKILFILFIPKQHQFLEFSRCFIPKPCHLLPGADTGTDNGHFSCLIICRSFFFPAFPEKHRSSPLADFFRICPHSYLSKAACAFLFPCSAAISYHSNASSTSCSTPLPVS